MDFVISRFSRLYPPFWIAIATTFIIVYLFGLPGRQVSFLTALKNIIMFHEYFGIPSVDGVYWTLKVELTFYFWMFLAYLVNALKKIEIFILLFMTVNVFTHQADVNFHPQLESILLFQYLPFFAIGICLYKIFYKKQNKLTVVTLVLALGTTFYLNSLTLFLLYLLFTIVFFLGVKGKIFILSNKILIFIGSISYSLYLLHQNIGYVIINKGYVLGVNPLISILFALIIISYISFRFVEVPSSKLIKKYYHSFDFNITSIPQLIRNKRNDDSA